MVSEFDALVDGYRRFRGAAYLQQKARFDSLSSDGQAPPVMIISCCDSRVDPATIFDTVPGQVFALRNVANLVPPFEQGGGLHGASAAIEFGVCGLKVKHIVVMGHGQCGGIAAALAGHSDDMSERSFVGDWMTIIDNAVERVRDSDASDPQRALEWEGVRVSIDNLRSFPFVAEREAAGELQLHGAWFAINEGQLYVLDDDAGTFAPA